MSAFLGSLHRISVVRRLAAWLLLLVMTAATAEPILADSCDGDAPRSASEAVLPHVEIGLLASARLADASVQSTTTIGHASLVVSNSDGSTGDPSSSGSPEHMLHVCHCTHAHGATLIRAVTLPAPAPGYPRLRQDPDRLPPSASRERQFRPPALPIAA